MAQPQNNVEYVLGIHNFEGRSEDELTLRKGDQIEIIETDEAFSDGWYIGRNLRTNEAGLFPKIFTTDLILPKSPVRQASVKRLDQIVNSSPPPMLPAEALTTHSPDSTLMEPFKPYASDMGRKASLHETLTDIDAAICAINSAPLGDESPRSMSSSSASPPVDQNKSPSTVLSWTPNDVKQYFLSRGRGLDVSDIFVQQEITGAILVELDLAALKEMGISTYGTRFELFRDIKELAHINTGTPSWTSGQSSKVGNNSWNATTPGSYRSPAKSDSSHAISSSSSPTMTKNAHPTNIASSHAREPSFDRNWNMGQKGIAIDSDYGYRQNESLEAAHAVSQRVASKDVIRDEDDEVPLGDLQAEKRQSSFYNGQAKHAKSTSSLLFNDESNTKHSRTGLKPKSGDHRRHSSIMSFMRSDDKTPDVDEVDPDLRQDAKGLRNILGLGNREKRSATVSNTDNSGISGSTGSTDVSSPDGQSAGFLGIGNRSASLGPARKFSKQKTSAFTEGIQQIKAKDSVKTADLSGWMYKKNSGTSVVSIWKSRYFVLHGTRLSYFGDLSDEKEKGLIDITAHKVLPARESEDKFVALYAAGVGAGRHCFKLVPPAPGFRKGVTFTVPKVHYFAVESKEEMRRWMAALMKATIERDDTVPLETTYNSPTLPLPKAQELFAQARAHDEDLRAKMIEGGLQNQKQAKTNSPMLANTTGVFPISTIVNATASSHANRSTSSVSDNSRTSLNVMSNGNSQPGQSSLSRNVAAYPATPDSPTNSSVTSSATTGSSITNSYSARGDVHEDGNVKHLTTKTAGLKVKTEL